MILSIKQYRYFPQSLEDVSGYALVAEIGVLAGNAAVVLVPAALADLYNRTNLCVDFVQQTWKAMFGEKEDIFNYFANQELADPGLLNVSWVVTYAEAKYKTAEEVNGEIEPSSRLLVGNVTLHNVYADAKNAGLQNRFFVTEWGREGADKERRHRLCRQYIWERHGRSVSYCGQQRKDVTAFR